LAAARKNSLAEWISCGTGAEPGDYRQISFGRELILGQENDVFGGRENVSVAALKIAESKLRRLANHCAQRDLEKRWKTKHD
jgi:hypothetical protein